MKSSEYLGPNDWTVSKKEQEEKRLREKMRQIERDLDRFDPRARSSEQLRRMAESEIKEEDDKTDGMEGMYGH